MELMIVGGETYLNTKVADGATSTKNNQPLILLGDLVASFWQRDLAANIDAE